MINSLDSVSSELPYRAFSDDVHIHFSIDNLNSFNVSVRYCLEMSGIHANYLVALCGE